MKKLLTILVLLLATSAVAQETYSIVISSPANVTKLDVGRQLNNQNVCTRFSLASSCTQAQACAASFTATGQPATGASCSGAEAQAANVRIYANTLAGREGFVANELIRAQLDVFARQRAKLDFAALQTFCRAATQPQIDGVCTASGLAAGCGVCDNFK